MTHGIMGRPTGVTSKCSSRVPRPATCWSFHHGTPGAALLRRGWPRPPPRGACARSSTPDLGTASRHRGWAGAWPTSRPTPPLSLDSLGVGCFLTLGWSGGGPHALACAALLPDRCRAAGSAGGVAPYEAFGPDGPTAWARATSPSSRAAAAGREELESCSVRWTGPTSPRTSCWSRSAASSRRSTSRRGAPASASTTWRARVRAPGAAPTAGATTTWRSWRRGASSWTRSGCRWPCGTGSRTALCRSRTDGGSCDHRYASTTSPRRTGTSH